MKKPDILDRWTIKEAFETYGIKNWGAGYFTINDGGEVAVTPFGKGSDIQVSLTELISGCKDRGHNMPVLLRFENILDSQLKFLNESFSKAIKKAEYNGAYKGVYPIKVNQQQQVLEEVVKFGKHYNHGLEVGSKAELIAALSVFNNIDACLICNGYKDEEFIDLGLYAVKLGIKCFFVIETPNEVETIINRSKELGIKPNIGLRIKLATKASGHWSESGGDRSIFGLNTAQLIEAVDRLKEVGMLDSIQLLHYHLGSQIPNIRDIRTAVYEGSRIYAELVREGCKMGYLDLGGGLAVDYDGSQTNFINSRNYTVEEYCVDIVEVIKSVMDENNIEHPDIITETGRATVAYYSVLLFDVLDVTRFDKFDIPENPPEGSHELIENLYEVINTLKLKNIQECYNDAIYYRDEIRELFKHGKISLRERSFAESIFWTIINKVSQEKDRLKNIPQDLAGIERGIADIYYCNFSLFQSVPDSWAIDQLFPIMPIHRLKEYPSRNAVIADITCDCDGIIDKFIDFHDVSRTLQVHPVKNEEDYYLGIFLVGAYQETLGDLHNLFGDTNVMSVRIYENGDYDFVREIEGDSVADVLSYVEYDPKYMIDSFRKNAEKAIRDGRISSAERKTIMNAYETGLRGYTYFEK